MIQRLLVVKNAGEKVVENYANANTKILTKFGKRTGQFLSTLSLINFWKKLSNFLANVKRAKLIVISALNFHKIAAEP